MNRLQSIQALLTMCGSKLLIGLVLLTFIPQILLIFLGLVLFVCVAFVIIMIALIAAVIFMPLIIAYVLFLCLLGVLSVVCTGTLKWSHFVAKKISGEKTFYFIDDRIMDPVMNGLDKIMDLLDFFADRAEDGKRAHLMGSLNKKSKLSRDILLGRVSI